MKDIIVAIIKILPTFITIVVVLAIFIAFQKATKTTHFTPDFKLKDTGIRDNTPQRIDGHYRCGAES